MLTNWNETDRESFRELVPLLYEDLRQVAHRHLRKARPDHTLQTTAPEETAEVTRLSPATVKRHWSIARVWLHKEMTRGALQ